MSVSRTLFHRSKDMLIACCVGIVSLELSLQVVGVIYRSLALHGQSQSQASAVVKILCVGDSNTWGHGAATRDAAYPARLQALFDEDIPGKVTVVNRGIPGQTSSEVANNLASLIEADRPNLVLVLIGANNFWNVMALTLPSPAPVRAMRWVLSHSKLYKAYALLHGYSKATAMEKGHSEERSPSASPSSIAALKVESDNPDALFALGQADLSASEPGKAIEPLMRCWTHSPTYPQVQTLLGAAYRDVGLYEQSVQFLHEALQQNPRDSQAYWLLGDLYHRMSFGGSNMLNEHACRMFEKAFELGASFRQTLTSLEMCYKDKQRAVDEIQRLAKLFSVSLSKDDKKMLYNAQQALRGIQTTGPAMFVDILERDLQQVVDTAVSRRVAVVFLTYPLNINLGNVNKIIRHAAARNSIPLVDLEAEFADKSRRSYGDYFTKDTHPNEAGYRIIAQAVFATLVRQGFPHAIRKEAQSTVERQEATLKK